MNDQDHAVDLQLAAIAACERLGGFNVKHLPKPLRRATPFVWTEQAFHAANEAALACPADTTILQSDLVEPYQWWVLPVVGDLPLPPTGQQMHMPVAMLIVDMLPTKLDPASLIVVRFSAIRTAVGFQPCVPSGAACWHYGTSWTTADHGEGDHDVWIADNIGLWPVSDSEEEMRAADRDMLGLLWHVAMTQHWLRSTVVGRTSVACARAVRRRAARQQLRTGGDVLVITLRHAAPAGSPRDVAAHEWTRRWLVHGHWRQQYLPSTHSHRPTFIADYVKGPEDKPLVVRPGRAYRVNR